MEKERGINWLGLFIKIIIIFIFVLIIIWLISKITLKTRLSNTFKNNLSNMETVATNYFKEIDLPLETGKSAKITLGEMMEKGLIVSTKDEDGISCDTKKSFSRITRKKKNYVMLTTLNCGKEKNTITKKFPFKDCKNCQDISSKDTSSKDNKNNIKDNNSTNNNTDNSANNNSQSQESSVQEVQKTTYYEYEKETKQYSNWVKGSVTGSDVENKYEYYSIANDIYYTIGVIRAEELKVGNTVNYTLKLTHVPNKEYYFSKINGSYYYNGSEKTSYLANKDSVMNKGNYPLVNSFSRYSLNSNNFSYKLSPYYRKGEFYVDVEITILDSTGVESYKYNSNNIYYVPLKLDLKFASNNITTTIPNGEYDTITYYRYVKTTRDVIWSSDDYVEGYTKTGNSEQR